MKCNTNRDLKPKQKAQIFVLSCVHLEMYSITIARLTISWCNVSSKQPLDESFTGTQVYVAIVLGMGFSLFWTGRIFTRHIYIKTQKPHNYPFVLPMCDTKEYSRPVNFFNRACVALSLSHIQQQCCIQPRCSKDICITISVQSMIKSQTPLHIYHKIGHFFENHTCGVSRWKNLSYEN